MAKSVNKVILLGHLGKDPEIRYIQNGTAVANFSMATTSAYKDRNDEWNETTEWHNIVAWGRAAETLSEYVRKGDKLYIEGKLQTTSWEDKDDVKHYKTQIVVQEFTLLGGKRDGDRNDRDDDRRDTRKKSSPRERQRAFDQGRPDPDYESSTQITDDDIPF